MYFAPLVEAFEEKNVPYINKNYLKKLPSRDYIFGPGDFIKVIVSRDLPELDTLALIDGEGTITLPKLKRVFVKDLSISELINVLNEAYEEYVNYPNIEVEVIEYRPIRVFVKGEVKYPGVEILNGSLALKDELMKKLERDKIELSNANNFAISNKNRSTGLVNGTKYFPTVFDAIRQSGGITRYADLTNIQVIRNNNISKGGGKISTFLNFEKAIINGDNTNNIRIYDQDTIVIRRNETPNDFIFKQAINSKLNPKFMDIYVSGRVRNPGKINLPITATLNDALNLAQTSVLKGPIEFIRVENDGNFVKKNIRYRKRSKRGSYNNPHLKQGDLIFVGESLFTTTSAVIDEVTSPFAGLFSAYGLYKAITDD